MKTYLTGTRGGLAIGRTGRIPSGLAANLSCLWLQVQVSYICEWTDYCSFVLVYLVKLLANVSSSSQLLQNYQNDNYYFKEKEFSMVL